MSFPLQPNYPDVNSLKPDFAAVQLMLPGLYTGPSPVGITGVSFSDTLESGKLRGNSPIMLGKTRGQYSAKASLEMYVDDAYALLAFIGNQAAQDPNGPFGAYEYTWSLELIYSVPGQNSGFTHNIQIVGIRIATISDDQKEGQDPLKAKVEFDDPYMIIRDGVVPFQPQATFWPTDSI